MRKTLFWVSVLCSTAFSSYAQDNTLTKRTIQLRVNQPDELKVTIGTPVWSNGKWMLGANLAISGGTPEYSYLWNPEEGVNSPTEKNPALTDPDLSEVQVVVTDQNNCTSCAILSIPTGIEETNETNLALYPLPAIDRLYIRFPQWEGETDITVYSINGETLQHRKINLPTDDNVQKISFAGYASGSYLVQVRHLSFVKTQVIIIK